MFTFESSILKLSILHEKRKPTKSTQASRGSASVLMSILAARIQADQLVMEVQFNSRGSQTVSNSHNHVPPPEALYLSCYLFNIATWIWPAALQPQHLPTGALPQVRFLVLYRSSVFFFALTMLGLFRVISCEGRSPQSQSSSSASASALSSHTCAERTERACHSTRHSKVRRSALSAAQKMAPNLSILRELLACTSSRHSAHPCAKQDVVHALHPKHQRVVLQQQHAPSVSVKNRTAALQPVCRLQQVAVSRSKTHLLCTLLPQKQCVGTGCDGFRLSRQV